MLRLCTHHTVQWLLRALRNPAPVHHRLLRSLTTEGQCLYLTVYTRGRCSLKVEMKMKKINST